MNIKKIELKPHMKYETKLLLNYLNLSKNRMKTFYSFKNNDIITAKKISEKTGTHIVTIGKSLKQLKEKELLILLNPNARANRKYKLSKKGRKIIKYLE